VLPLELAALGWAGSEEHWGYVALFRINRIAKVWKVETQHSLVINIIYTGLKYCIHMFTYTYNVYWDCHI